MCGDLTCFIFIEICGSSTNKRTEKKASRALKTHTVSLKWPNVNLGFVISNVPPDVCDTVKL